MSDIVVQQKLFLHRLYLSCYLFPFLRYGRIEEVHILPQKHPSQGIAAFIDFYECSDAIGACRERHRMGGRDLRLNYKFTDKSSPDSAHSPPPRGGKDNQRDQRMRKKR